MDEEAIAIATKLMDNDENYLENIIALYKIGNNKYNQCWDTEFHIFGVIESETDHLPLKHMKKNCSDEFLAQSDKKLSEIIEFYKDDVISACNKIIKQ